MPRRISSYSLQELCSRPLYIDLTSRMEQAFNDIKCAEDAGELMAIFGLVTAGLVKFYENHSNLSEAEELERFRDVVEQCMKLVEVIPQSVH